MGKKEKIRFILIILAVFIVVGLKVAAFVWQKQQKPQVIEKQQQTPTCSIQYCEFADGLIMRTEGTVSSKTPFKVFIRNLPQGVEKAYIQFSMESMDLGFNRFKLFPSENNPQEWRTNALLLPVCTIDDDRYDMDICLNDCNKAYRVRFRAR